MAARLAVSAALIAVFGGAAAASAIEFDGRINHAPSGNFREVVGHALGIRPSADAARPGNKYSDESERDKIPVALPGSENTAFATCSPLRGPEPWGVCVEFRVLAAKGHGHESGMPAIELIDSPECFENVSGDIDRVYWTFRAPAFASEFKIVWRYSGKCKDKIRDLRAPVGIGGLEEIPMSSEYDLLEGTREHPNAHYLTAKALTGLRVLVARYRSAFPGGPNLIIGNASLPQGGLFDLYGDWKPPFASHRDGQQVDVLVNSVPEDARAAFEEFAAASGAGLLIEDGRYHLDYSGSPAKELRCY